MLLKFGSFFIQISYRLHSAINHKDVRSISLNLPEFQNIKVLNARGPCGLQSFPHMKCILKFGTGVSSMESFLVDGIVRVEENHNRVSG